MKKSVFPVAAAQLSYINAQVFLTFQFSASNTFEGFFKPILDSVTGP